MRTLIRNAVSHRHLLWNFVQRDLRVKYRGTLLGYLWSLLEPLSMAAVYWFVFVVIAERGGPGYPLTVLLGVLPYTYFSSVVTGGANALSANRGLIRRVYLPRELFVLAHLGTQTVVLGLSLGVVVPGWFVYGIVPEPVNLLWVPAAVVGLGTLAGGLGLALSCVQVLYRDVGYVLKVLLRLAMYASPVIYPLSMVPESLRPMYLLNPLAVWISLVRTALANDPLSVPPWAIGLSFAEAVAVAWVGAALFRRWQHQAVKYL
ncbi:MAG TPA: ABC transporter permease [Myxococcales bacterium LLY-WYZ-16_1]|nr:ABC transporter permease [Myxococcales bacterium LLY-WYZ-16_1]